MERALLSASATEHRDLIEFLSREFGRAKERMCVEVGLFQAPVGSRGQELRTWAREENPEMFENLSNIEGIAATMLDIAQREATTRGTGRHRFEVRTTQHLRATQKHSFHLIVEPEEEFPGMDGGADEKGQIAQQMRHSEWAIRAMLGMVQTNTSGFQQQIRYLTEENRRLADDRARAIVAVEAARAEQDERTMAMVLAERADDRKDKVLNKLLPLAPVALSRLVSKDAPPGAGGSALAPILKELVKGLTPEQVGKLSATFSMEQRILFGEAIKIVQEIDAAERASEKPDEKTSNGAAPGASP